MNGSVMMIDNTLKIAQEALKQWKETITVEQFIEDHKRIGLTKNITCADSNIECNYSARIHDIVICTNCGSYKNG